MTSRTRQELAAVAAFTVLAFSPFLAKAYSGDEPSNLAAAAHILVDPFHPYAFTYTWFGRALPYELTSNNPPLYHYLLALALKLAGRGELALRLTMLPLAVAAGLSLYLIAARFLKHPLLPTLTVIAGPAWLINMGHLMGEQAAAAFGLAGLAALLQSLDENSAPWFWTSAALLDAALLCKYHAALFLIPAAAWCLSRGVKPARTAAYLTATGAGLALYLAGDALIGGSAFSATRDTLAFTARFPTSAWSHRLRALLAFTGGCGAAAALWPLRARRPGLKAGLIVAAGAALLFSPPFDLVPGPNLVDRLTGIAFAAAAAWACVIVWDGRRKPGGMLWLSWLISALVFCAAYWSITTRVIFFALPPLAFAAAQTLEERLETRQRRRLYALSLAATTALTLALGLVDTRFADAQKNFALQLKRDYLDKGRRVWYTGGMALGDELSRSGGQGLDADRGGWDLARPGDVVAVLKINSTGLRPTHPRPADVTTWTLEEPIPLRLISGGNDEAAFYSSVWGFLPFAFSREPLEEFSIVELK
ncbi:MAG: hypothetical protein HKL90_00445 [Elusimicrobia bacterium]|nr:hypothetical protein [Elusimicrobiota bacterium]